MSTEDLDQRIAYAFLRVIFGVNICFHGLSRLLGDHGAFLAYLNQSMARAALIPKAAIPPFAALLPWLEAIAGLFILLGFFTRFALIFGSAIMLVLMAGITLAQNWDVAGLQLIYCLIYFLLLTYRSRNFYSLDTLVAERKKGSFS
ncbi:MAG TPA: DoxX family protein [Candidatus Acidoferrum sp.]|nr:DoxX family protein [Candidatus Acidoferrum sp.]